jgi:uncharacterized tellurite resistance protein B-like protein
MATGFLQGKNSLDQKRIPVVLRPGFSYYLPIFTAMEFEIQNEQEAAAAILFASAMQEGGQISEQQVEHLSRAVVLCSKFRGSELNELTRKAISIQSRTDLNELLDTCAPLITEEFRETLFAMVSEVVLLDGQINDDKTRVFAMLALYLNISMERMKMILATYLIRNKWNVQIVDSLEQ